jgi:beta-N-acetylhexosaminidase
MTPRMPLAAILGCSGTELRAVERDFFAAADPLGFILFERNCADPDQLRALTSELRGCVGRDDAPILIDQEGGRVQRLKPPHWRRAPAGAAFAALARQDAGAAEEAAYLNARLIAGELHASGIDVDCAPVLDVPQPGGDPVIGDRALGADPATVSALGRQVCAGLTDGGVVPVIKHIPGHGRATADSHEATPVVDAAFGELEAVDFAPFRAVAAALGRGVWGMTAHVVFDAIDPEFPATVSARVIGETIRGAIGFDGFLVSDDLSMKALSDRLAERAAAALAAGCDAVLHCNGKLEEMEQVVEGSRTLDGDGLSRFAASRPHEPRAFERAAALARLDSLLALAAAA